MSSKYTMNNINNKLNFDYKNTALVSAEEINILFNKIKKQINQIQQEINNKVNEEDRYNTKYAALYLPEDKQIINKVKDLAQKILDLNPTLFILIGIGGSNLGTIAVIEALYGSFYNNINNKIKFYCSDTVDNAKNLDLLNIAKNELDKSNKIIINIVTKSGTTTETLVNGALFVDLLKIYYPETYKKYIIITTDDDSQLLSIAQENNYHYLEIPKNVGGRYSVLSAVGLFALAVLGVDIENLLSGALDARNLCLSTNINDNISAVSAAIIYANYKKNYNILDTFIFYPNLSMFGAWYRQLIAESLGKSHSITGQLVNLGMTPTVSIGTTDLHSVAQLYLSGPYDKFTSFIYCSDESDYLKVPNNDIIKPLPILAGMSITYIKQSIFKAVQIAYKKEKRPFMTIIFPRIDAYLIGQFIMMKMCQVIYLGYLLDINAFDQPGVELYKQETRRILGDE